MTLDSKIMEVKKTPPQIGLATPTASSSITKRIADYIANVKSEFFKITWTPRDELKTYALIVVVATFVLGLAVFFVDVFIRAVLSAMSVVVHTIFG